ncbi:MAG: extracellular solute-binding protein [Clostridia bacterium]|nr:extracellular solute-binding protein [Clostridia bacterium]
MLKLWKKASCLLLAILILTTSVWPAMAAKEEAEDNTVAAALSTSQKGEGSVGTTESGKLDITAIPLVEAQSYKEFLTSKGAKDEKEALSLGGKTQDLTLSNTSTSGQCSVDGEGNVNVAEEGYATFQLPAGAKGLYQVQLEYDVDPARTRDVECAVLLDNNIPFEESRDISLSRLWKNDTKKIQQDANGNDIKPSQICMTFEERGWLVRKLQDSAGYYSEPLLFDVDGKSTITFVALRESVKIHSVTLIAPKPLLTYEQYSAQYKDIAGAKQSLDVIQGEDTYSKSDATLTPQEDRISPITTPRDGSKIRLNYIGGKNWSTAGQEVTWRFTPTETAMYEIRMRTRQLYSSDIYSARILRINGNIPFEEAADIHFTYDTDWSIYTVSANDEPCKFYFEAGKTYDLSLCVTLGDMGPVLERLEKSIAALNDIYRELIMVMSSTPDTDRDYELEKLIPEIVGQKPTEKGGKVAYPKDQSKMKIEADELLAIEDTIKEISGSSGSALSSIHKTALQLRDFLDDPNTIASQLKYYKDNIASLSEVMTAAQARPIDIDYICIAAPDDTSLKAEGSFFQKIWYKTQLFVASFVEDYNSLAGTSDGVADTITVWTTFGRDQASIINELVRSYYTPESKESYGQTIGVDLQVVPIDALMPSVAAGNGPDVLLNASAKLPVEYAMRGASANLYKDVPQDELKEVLARFVNSEQAIVPFSFNGGLYGLPDQYLYTVMFYRVDVLKQLGITPPTLDNPWSWEDVIDILPTLQSNNMSILMETGDKTGADVEQYGINTYAIFLYQNNGSFYTDDFKASALSSENAVEAFEYWTNLYTSYGLPTNFDLLSRFRTGESPILLSDFPFYNNLSVAAPELKGLWSMALVPGTIGEDGKLNNATKGGGTSVILMDACENKLAGWDFLKWWTSTKTQTSYATNLECLLGTAARYATANKEAFNSLAWSKDELATLNAESVKSQTIPETPGSYYTPRHINNAFRAVCIKERRDDARETILKYAKIITNEIEYKRDEFKLDENSKEVEDKQ